MYTRIQREPIARKLKRHKVILTAIVLVLTFWLILSSDLSPDLYFINFGVEDVSCHYLVKGDALDSVNGQFAPASNSIFFHETSCRGGLNSRQACSIESAARAHPKWEVYVLFSAPVNKIEDLNMELLKKFANVKFMRVHLVEYAKGTPLESLVGNGALNRTRWPISHTSDVLRFLTLFKWGGIYLDLDTVVAKPLDGLPKNWAARENNVYVASSALAFYRDAVGGLVADAALRDLSKSFRGDVWGQNGPCLITRVLQKVCSISDITAMSADKCRGFEVFGPELFYPVGPGHPEEFFKPGDIGDQESYIYHIWNQQTKHLKIMRDSPYAKLAKRHCPVVYETYRDFFGV